VEQAEPRVEHVEIAPRLGPGHQVGREPRQGGQPRAVARREPGELTAVQIAVRLYRLNGPGVFRDRVLLGQSTSAGLNADMMSQDGPMTAVYQGNVYWTFGDTNHQRADRSNYRGSAASSSLSADPERWFPLTYVHQIDGREAAIAPTSEFDHAGALAWPGGLVSV